MVLVVRAGREGCRGLCSGLSPSGQVSAWIHTSPFSRSFQPPFFTPHPRMPVSRGAPWGPCLWPPRLLWGLELSWVLPLPTRPVIASSCWQPWAQPCEEQGSCPGAWRSPPHSPGQGQTLGGNLPLPSTQTPVVWREQDHVGGGT